MAGLPVLAECSPGVDAVGFRIVVAVEPVEEKTAGGIILPDANRDRSQMTQVRGRIISQGSVCWDFANFPADTTPKVGDAIMYGNLAGYQFEGADKKAYRLIQDRDVSAIIREDVA